MYEVKVFQNKPHYRKGDLEEKLELVSAKSYKTRREAKAYIESKLDGKSGVYRSYKRGNEKSVCQYTTNQKWIHENTGEDCYEYFRFELTKHGV